MKNSIRIMVIVLTMVLSFVVCGCNKQTDNLSSVITKIDDETIIIDNETQSENATLESDLSNISEDASNVSEEMSDVSSQEQVLQSQESSNDASSENNSSDVSSEDASNGSSTPPKEQQINSNLSAYPTVTVCTQVADNTYVVAGVCSTSTEYIRVSGANVNETKIIPAKGEKNNYFISQVKVIFNTTLEIQGKEKDKELSEPVKKNVSLKTGIKNMMTASDYQPVIGNDSRTHFYSAILTYTKSNFLNDTEKTYAVKNMAETVSAANSVGAEVIYLVVPSSAAVYPETVPSEYTAASGETLYSAFKNIAEQNGATVLYPLDVMKAHKNDGEGYKIYSHTDSHWTTYGAYWGVNTLMSHIASKFPSAAPRTVQEMEFYTTELYGGDSLFSFGDNVGFEIYNHAAITNGKTKITKINELTTLYKLKMPTDTLTTITRGKNSIYLTKDISDMRTEINPNGEGLPTALIVRDSFGRTAYDIVNDRFSKTVWMAENDYSSAVNAINENKPNYVIYIVSERNLLKVMMNEDVSLSNRFK